MKIAIIHKATLPVTKYGGTERVVWDLAEELHKQNHEITFVVNGDSEIPFGKKIAIESITDIRKDLPKDIDVLHFHSGFEGMEDLQTPFIFTLHGNIPFGFQLSKNTVFISKNQCDRYGGDNFVYNGLNWENYQKPNLENQRSHFHFLGKGAWRLKNLQGAIDIVKNAPKEKLFVMGGKRFNINMGIRLTFTPKAKFFGMVDNNQKSQIMNTSKGLIFPVLWNEPFGLAIIESLYFGCPVFGTPYGALPEIITKEYGFLSNSREKLTEAIKNWKNFDKNTAHQYALENFSAKVMANNYIKMYEKVMNGETINAQNPTLKIEEPKFLSWLI